MTEPHNQNNPGAAPEEPPVKRTCTIDTPPVALTPADDGSDFYNTPLGSGTPVTTKNQTEEAAATSAAAEAPASSNPPPQIPGLSLVNGSLNDQTSQDDSGVNENWNPDATVISEETAKEGPPPAAQIGSEAKSEVKEEAAVKDTDAMEVEQEDKQLQTELQESAGASSGATAEAAVPTQTEEGQEGEEEHPEWELDSSPYESSSDDSTDSSDSDDEDEDYPILSAEEQARILMQGEMGSDDEGEGKGKSGAALKTANEIPEEVLPIPDITVTPEMKIVLLGHVEAAIENTVLIAANVTGEYQVLEAGSLLCLEDRRIAGVVSETLGRVENPLYTVKFATTPEVEERGLSRGIQVYYVEQHSTFVFTQPLKGLKGSDASNFHDEEVAEDEVEFSDDEQEAEYRRKLKQKRQERKGARNQDGGPAKAGRGPPGPSKLSQSELNYDDNIPEDGYTPLPRPKNLHEMMHQEAPVEGDRSSNRHSGLGGGRGRGRGSDRGRGGRGRGRGGQRDHHGHGQSHHGRQPYHQQDRPDAPSHSQQHHQPQPQHCPPYNAPQQYPSYPPQQSQQQAFAQGTIPTAPFNFQMPYQQAYQQPNPYQQMSPTPHINPLFLAALQQQQQYQQAQAQAQAQPQQAQPETGQPQAQGPPQTMNFDQVKAQLDLLRQLSNGQQQWPPRS
ncbi:RNA-binding snoRNP assembly protein NAF1 [Aspergillus undulatus]|uniref:RNA-binding snoRNP assembly protein NAF1 n=1 Tax=Aspergillus undulatus TaxID=1810928 RepID=UPI003CCDA9FB